MSIEFFQSMMGKMFYEGTVPRITKALERIATALEKQVEPTEARPPDPLITPNHDKIWNSDRVQFTRMVAELRMSGLTKKQYSELQTSMGLTEKQIDELLERGEEAWEDIKERT